MRIVWSMAQAIKGNVLCRPNGHCLLQFHSCRCKLAGCCKLRAVCMHCQLRGRQVEHANRECASSESKQELHGSCTGEAMHPALLSIF